MGKTSADDGSSSALAALRKVDFDWTAHIDEIWVDQRNDAPELQASIRAELEEHLDDLNRGTKQASPLGLPLLGPAGSGKTHLLGMLRRTALDRGMYFILVDMTDVADFWDTVALGYLRSLQQVVNGKRQIDTWLEGIIQRYGSGIPKKKSISHQRPPGLINTTDRLIASVRAEHRAEVQEHADVLRALVLFACDHADVNDLGYKWLQGLGVEDELEHHGFRQAQQKPSRIVRGLSWLLSLQAPTVLALDQLDAIVAEHELARGLEGDDELTGQQMRSRAIIQGIAGGLLDLRDVTRRTLSVISSLEATWDILDRQAAVSMADRYESRLLLRSGGGPEIMKKVVVSRLAAAYSSTKFSPPYPSYPYADGFFEKYQDNTPRELLRACDTHRRACRKAGVLTEASGSAPRPTVAPPSPAGWQEAIATQVSELARRADLTSLLHDESEDRLDRLVEAACDALVIENPVGDDVIPRVDKDFMGTGNYDPLHARLRLILTNQQERERHHSFRFLEKSHYRAFQARLKAALTASGIDHDLGFRGLTVIRVASLPSGPASNKLVAELHARGGRLITPSDDELRTLVAISELLRTSGEPENFEQWLTETRPVSQMSMFQPAVEALYRHLEVEPASPPRISAVHPTRATSIGATTSPIEPSAATATPVEATSPATRTPESAPRTAKKLARSAALPIGHRLLGGEAADAVSIPLERVPYHTCVFAGSGSGKTVFLKRVIEEAALLGIPSIVIDGANDLSRLGDPWPEPPPSFTDDDVEKAARYHASTEVVVWTPGASSGNPMRLNPLPDFAALSGDSPTELDDERRTAVDMATSSLSDLLIRHKGSAADKSAAVLRGTLQHFSQRGGSLHDLVRLLREPPDEVIEPFSKGDKIAHDMSEALHAVMINDPLIGGTGAPLDPALLFRASHPEKTRISVLNLVGLQGYDEKRRFLDQLASTLFTWIKKNPAPPGGLLGLLILDEAKDFVPAGKKVPGKENIARLAAQARKYGLGLLFATQEPKSIDHTIVSNCSTLLGGKMNSPAAIDALQQLLADKGTNARDVGSLGRGQFYFCSGADKPRKIATSLCLSYHPSTPPSERDVLDAAKRSATTLTATGAKGAPGAARARDAS